MPAPWDSGLGSTNENCLPWDSDRGSHFQLSAPPLFLHCTGDRDVPVEAMYVPRTKVSWYSFHVASVQQTTSYGSQGNSGAIQQEAWEALRRSGLCRRRQERLWLSPSCKSASFLKAASQVSGTSNHPCWIWGFFHKM